MIKLATIGTSEITDKFLAAVNETDGISLAAVYSRTSVKGKAFADKYGVGLVFTNLEELAKSNEIDAVYIASPNSLHYSQSKLFLENGKHVICEKPITMKRSEFEELRDLALNNNLVYIEAMISLYLPAVDIIKEAIKTIGPIKSARFSFCKVSSKYDDYQKGKRASVFDPLLGGGSLTDLGVYCVYAAELLFGSPNKIRASKITDDIGCDLSGSSVFEYDDFYLFLDYSKVTDRTEPSVIIGEEGSIEIDLISQLICVRLKKGGVSETLVPFHSRTEVMKYEAEAFVDFIEGKRNDLKKVHLITENVQNLMDIIKKEAN